MRVVAGDARGRPLQAPSGNRTRPTSDRVRESIFNMLFSLGATEDAEVVDLYAGCGALGIEALSRGAKSCTFVERDSRAIECIKENLETLGYTDSSRVVASEVVPWLDANVGKHGLVLADPPYADEEWEAILDRVDCRFLVAESGGSLDAHERWKVVREKAYGTTVVTVLERQQALS